MSPRRQARFDGAEPPFVLLSASIPDGHKAYQGSVRHRQSAHPQWIRDAVLATSRAALQRGFRLRLGAHPSISPMLLMVAREFPPTGTPPIEVYQSKFFHGQYPAETYELAQDPYGVLEEIDAERDKDTSLARMRNEMIQRRGLIAALFVGGMDGVLDESHRFKAHHGATLPAYAIASAGGAAADLLDSSHGGNPLDFSGGPLAPVDPALLREEQVGYTRIARKIFHVIELAIRTRKLRAAP